MIRFNLLNYFIITAIIMIIVNCYYYCYYSYYIDRKMRL